MGLATISAQAAQRVAATAVPAARCQSLHLGAAARQQPGPGRDGADGAGSCAPHHRPAFGHTLGRRNTAAASFSDHQQQPLVEGPSSRSNGDPGATSSGAFAGGDLGSGNGGAQNAEQLELSALRAEMEALRQTVSTQAAAAQQQFMSITSLERKSQGAAAAPAAPSGYQSKGEMVLPAQ